MVWLCITDAEGVSRRVYNLRARWRSPAVRAEIPAELYRSICEDAGRRWQTRVGGRKKARKLWCDWVMVLAVVAVSLILIRSELRPAHQLLVSFAMFVIAGSAIGNVILVVLAAFFSLLWRLMGRVPVGATVDYVAAMVAHGRCASCAHGLDPSNEESEGVVRCPECGAAWRTAAVAGGDVASE